MELCTATSRALSTHLLLPQARPLSRTPSFPGSIHLSISSLCFFSSTGLDSCSKTLMRATKSDETSSEVVHYNGDISEEVVAVEEDKTIVDEIVQVQPSKGGVEVNDQAQPFAEFLDKVNRRLDSGNSFSLVLYGGGALLSVWLLSAIVGAIDGIPVFPKLLEVVGLGYTLWFTTRYLLFKSSRDELVAKLEEIKEQVIGSGDD